MVSNNFINECKNRANKNRLGKIIIDGIEEPITNSDNLQSFSVNSGCYINGDIIGSVYSKCLKANFVSNINDLTDKSIYAKIGVKYVDLSEEHMSIGKYRVEHPNNEITASMSQITAYDDLYTKLDDKYVCNIDYEEGNKTLSDLYVDVCNQLGLIPETTEILNANIPITNNPFTNGEKNRTVLQTVSKISCSWVEIDNDTNKIKLCWLSQNEEPDYTFYKNDYVSVDGGEITYGPINCLIIKNSVVDDENITIKDDESIALYGEHSITINENYILYNAELRQQAITSIWNRVKGLKYVDCKLITYYGKPFLKLGDKIRIYISATEYFDTYVFNHIFTYDGTFASEISSPALTEQEIKTKQDVSLGQLLINTQIEVNKQKQEIKSTISKTIQLESNVGDINTNLNNNYLSSDQLEAKYGANIADVSLLQQQMSEVKQTVADYNISLSTLAGTLSEMSYNFNTDRLKIAKSDDPINLEANNKGFKIYNYVKLATIINEKGLGTDKLIVTGTAQIGYLKFVKNHKNGANCTTIHVLEQLIEDLTDLESD